MIYLSFANAKSVKRPDERVFNDSCQGSCFAGMIPYVKKGKSGGLPYAETGTPDCESICNCYTESTYKQNKSGLKVLKECVDKYDYKQIPKN